MFIQPQNDIPCLLGMNVLPGLGVQFLRGSGVSLLGSSRDTSTMLEDSNQEDNEALALASLGASLTVSATEELCVSCEESVPNTVGGGKCI